MSAPDARRGPSDDGANQVWGLISTLVAGPAVWGAVGFGADRLAGTAFLTPVGVVVGFLTSLYVVYVKAIRGTLSDTMPVARSSSKSEGTTDSTPASRPSSTPRTTDPIAQHGRSEVPTRDAASPDADRPYRGDVR